MEEIERLRQKRWEILFKLHNYYLDRPGDSVSARKVCEDLDSDCESNRIKAAFVYLHKKELIEAILARDGHSGLHLLKAEITALGIDLVEQAIETQEASLKKRPVGFGAWHIAGTEANQSFFLEGGEQE